MQFDIPLTLYGKYSIARRQGMENQSSRIMSTFGQATLCESSCSAVYFTTWDDDELPSNVLSALKRGVPAVIRASKSHPDPLLYEWNKKSLDKIATPACKVVVQGTHNIRTAFADLCHRSSRTRRRRK